MKIKRHDYNNLFAFLAFVTVGFFLHFCNYDNSVFALTKYEEDFFAQNNNFFYEPCVGGSGGISDGVVGVSGGVAEEKIWSGLTSFLTEEQAAGVMGNIFAESEFNPIRRNGDNTNFNIWGSSGGALGLVQWTGSRRLNMLAYVKERNESLIDLFSPGNYTRYADDFIEKVGQEIANELYTYEIAFLKSELDKGYKGIYNQTDPAATALWFCMNVEIPGKEYCYDGKRTSKAKEFYEKYAGKTIVGNGVSSAGSGVSSSALTSSVHAKAWELANQTREQAKSGPTPEYKAALEAAGVPQSSDSCANTGQSCDRFVATVLKTSGVDLDVPWGDTSVQAEYFASHPEIYTEVQGDPADTSTYQPGDIRIRSGHVEIYGEKDGNSYILAASHCDRWAGYQSFYADNEEYKIYRTTGMPACSGQGTRDMSQTALDLAWSSDADSGDANYLSGSATDKYKEAASKVNVSADGIDGTDSGYFVETVARYAGIDEGFKASDEYLSGDGSSKWETIKWEESDWQEGKQLQSGDIIQCKNTSGSSQYYVVSKSGEGFTSIGASYGSKYGSVNNEPLSASDCAEQNIIRNKNANTNNSDDCDACAGQGGGSGMGLKEGGMTLEEAKSFMAFYRNEASKKIYISGGYMFDGAWVGSTIRPEDGNLNNCTAFSQWFVNRYTTIGPKGSPAVNGSKMVGELKNKGLETGSEPRPYAIFSWGSPNHTGVVLGVSGDKVIVGEASYHNGFTDKYPNANEYSISSMKSHNTTYAYTDNVLKGGL